MIFNKNDDLRGCTVRLRCMEPGESVTIPEDADRYRCISHVGYWWDGGSAFQNTNGCAWLGRCDIVEVLHRPQKPCGYTLETETVTTTDRRYVAGDMVVHSTCPDNTAPWHYIRRVHDEATGLMSTTELCELHTAIGAALEDTA